MKKQEILDLVKNVVVGMTQQEQADFIWDIICETNINDATMDRIDGGYEIILEMSEEDLAEQN